MVLETHIKLCVTVPDFLKKTCSSQNRENGPKIRFSEFIEKFGRYFFLNLAYNESLNSIFGKNLVPEI